MVAEPRLRTRNHRRTEYNWALSYEHKTRELSANTESHFELDEQKHSTLRSAYVRIRKPCLFSKSHALIFLDIKAHHDNLQISRRSSYLFSIIRLYSYEELLVSWHERR